MTDNIAIVSVFAVVFGAMAPLLLVGLVLLYKHRKLRLTHETILKLAEKGAAIPPEMLAQHCESRSSDLRRGLVLSLIGVALAIFLAEVGAPWSIGLIPMFAGFGYLITWKLESRDRAGITSRPVQQV